MSCSALELVSTITGTGFRAGSSLMTESTSRPSTFGRLRSSSTSAGSSWPAAARAFRMSIACSPSAAMMRWLRSFASSNAARVRATSPGLSSTSRMSRSMLFAAVVAMGLRLRRRQGEMEGGTEARGGIHRDGAPVPLHDSLAEAQADAVAGEAVAGVKPLEDHEDAILVFPLDADAVVRHREAPPLPGACNAYAHARRGFATELDGIGNQVL